MGISMKYEIPNDMKKERITIYVSRETYTIFMDLWFKIRSQDRKTDINDIVEQAIKDYAKKYTNDNTRVT